MKKQIFAWMLSAVMLLVLSGCQVNEQTNEEQTDSSFSESSQEDSTSASSIGESTDTTVITFKDAYLEEAVRQALNKSTGNITLTDAESLTKLDVSNSDWDAMNAKGGAIRDISGLEYFVNLIELHLDMNDIADLAPISFLAYHCLLLILDLSIHHLIFCVNTP